MWQEDQRERADGEDPEAVGDEALPLVLEGAQRANFGRVLAVVLPEWAEDDVPIDFDESLALWDDGFWHRVAWWPHFTWQWFLNWWVARRYVQPRDVTRR